LEQHKGKHIVCLALPAWEADYLRSTVELMKGLAKDNLVLYVDYAYSITDCLRGMTGTKKVAWKRMLGIQNRVRKIKIDPIASIYVLSLPPVIPSLATASYRLFKTANRINAVVTGYVINRAIRKLQMKNIIEFNSFQPFLGNYWKIKNVIFRVFYIYDEFSNVPFFRGFVKDQEKLFIERSDLLIVTSDELKKRKQYPGKPIETVNNGVNFQSFYSQINPVRNTGTEKILGYTGNIDGRIDIDLIESVICGLPQIRFLFIGKISEQNVYNRLSGYPNVTFKPPVAAAEVPALQCQFSAGMIPYVCNDLTAAIYPLKANEYLAMGLPVIMTPFASIGKANQVVYIAGDAPAFISAVEQALAENDDTLTEQRIAIAKSADWQERSNQLLEVIEYHMNNTDTIKATGNHD
jgi:glycosyltransferase involved in cell wall biosynthesis